MTIRKRNGKTVFGLYTKYTLEDNVVEHLDELCKMVDTRDVIISISNAELLKRGCRISELEQECDKRGRDINTVHDGENMYHSWYNAELAKNAILKEKIGYMESDGDNLHIATIADLAQELKSLKAAKDKADTENTSLKEGLNNMFDERHRLRCDYQNICDEISLNETIDNRCKRIAGLKETQSTYEIAYRAYASENYELRNEIKLLKQHVNISVSTSA